MHMATTLMVKSIRPAARSGANVAEQDAAAEGLALWAQAIPGMFPAGSDLPDSRARPEIWRNKADFDARAAAFGEAAARLETLAKAGDAAAFAAQVDVVQSRCSACHQSYRS
jgi:cytochrome c556